MVRVLANDGLDSVAVERLRAHGCEVDTHHYEGEELLRRVAQVDVLVVRSATRVTAEVLRAGRGRLRMVIRAGVGTDNIDVEAARHMGIEVANTPGASTRSVAELALAHMLTLARGLHISNRQLTTHGGRVFRELKKRLSSGIELKGKTLGIVGAGRIGRELGSMALALGMEVVFSDPNVEEVVLAVRIADAEVEVKRRTVPLEELLRCSDFVSLHVPAMERPLITAREVAMMKDGAILINCARGGVIDEKAVYEALRSGKLGGVGLDVFEGEPDIAEWWLNEEGVSLTPHIGASTVEAQQRIGEEVVRLIVEKLVDTGGV